MAGTRVIGFGTALSLLALLVGCVAGEPTTGQATTGKEAISIADIIASPARHEGKTVTLTGEYRGWEPGHGSPPVTRSDWILKDETGAIYVTGKLPPGFDPSQDVGRKITVSGVVRVKNGQAYIEAKIIR